MRGHECRWPQRSEGFRSLELELQMAVRYPMNSDLLQKQCELLTAEQSLQPLVNVVLCALAEKPTAHMINVLEIYFIFISNSVEL